MKQEVFVLLDNIRSLYNVGSIFRSAEAVGASKIILSGISGVEKFSDQVKLHPKLAKTALAGTSVPWEYSEKPLTKLKELKGLGFQIVSLEITEASVDYSQVDYKLPLCLVVGHERLGVNEEINRFADKIIQIPMKGAGNSLNVAVATALALYKIKERT